MDKNKVSVTINSRQYTVKAAETPEYIEGLAEHINSKIRDVFVAGSNIIGERPLVLAALNVCDEYFKVIQLNFDMNDKIEKLESDNADFKKRFNALGKDSKDKLVKAAEIDKLQKEIVNYSKELAKAQNTIKTLEAHIKRQDEKHKTDTDKLTTESSKKEKELIQIIDQFD